MQVVNDDKPNIRTAMTCPVRSCTAVCDLVVMQVGLLAVGEVGWGGRLEQHRPPGHVPEQG